MRKIVKYIIASVICLGTCLTLGAKSIPKLKRAEEVSTGTFANGIEYCLVNNRASVGRADFALVQFGNFDVGSTRESFDEVYHMDARKFLVKHSVPYTEDGLISYYDNARVFRFPEMDISNSALADSTMLMMLDFMQLSDGGQTLIICGDINKEVYQRTLRTLSLVVPETKSSKYESNLPKESTVLQGEIEPGCFNLTFSLGSVSREEAGTAVPLMTEFMYLQVRNILYERISRAFKAEDIPFYIDDSDVNISINYSPEYEEIARSIIDSAIADLATGGATMEEISYAKDKALPLIISNGLKPGKPNSFYTDKCISATLFGSNLASEETIKNFFYRRKISEHREMELFNQFASALFESDFDISNSEEFRYKRQENPDIFAALKLRPAGAKLESTTKDPLLGGLHWTFSNGIRVLYKYSANESGFNFCLAQRGGASSMPDLKYGESRFLSDIFLHNRYSGIEGEEFDGMLRSRGIELYRNVSLEKLVLGGTAPAEEIETVLRALLKIAYDREPDEKSFEFYRKCQILRSDTELPSVNAVMDSLLCQEYAYQENSSAHNMKDDLYIRANKFFDERFSNVADGIFIFIGNIPEKDLLNALSKYLGGFHTSGPFALRERIEYDLYSGRRTYIVEGDDSSVNLAAMGRLPVNIDNYLLFLMAQEAVSRQFAKTLAPIGMYAEVSGRYTMAPVEKYNLYVTLRACPDDGLPAGVNSLEPMDAIKEVREEFLRMQYMVISNEDFASYKAVVKGRIAAKLSSSDGMMQYALNRYSDGRDLVTEYGKKIDAIVIDDVRWLLEEIISSGVVEYIIK